MLHKISDKMKTTEVVMLKNLRVTPDEKGGLMEALSCDDGILDKFGLPDNCLSGSSKRMALP